MFQETISNIFPYHFLLPFRALERRNCDTLQSCCVDACTQTSVGRCITLVLLTIVSLANSNCDNTKSTKPPKHKKWPCGIKLLHQTSTTKSGQLLRLGMKTALDPPRAWREALSPRPQRPRYANSLPSRDGRLLVEIARLVRCLHLPPSCRRFAFLVASDSEYTGVLILPDGFLSTRGKTPHDLPACSENVARAPLFS